MKINRNIFATALFLFTLVFAVSAFAQQGHGRNHGQQNHRGDHDHSQVQARGAGSPELLMTAISAASETMSHEEFLSYINTLAASKDEMKAAERKKIGKKMNAKMQKNKARRGEMREQRQEKRMKFLTKVLKLDDAQQKQISEMHESQQALAEAHRAEVQESGEFGPEFREDRVAFQKANKEEMSDKLRQILDDNQWETFEALQALLPEKGPRNGRRGRSDQGPHGGR